MLKEAIHSWLNAHKPLFHVFHADRCVLDLFLWSFEGLGVLGGLSYVSFFPRLCGVYLSVSHHAWIADLSPNLIMAFLCLWVLWRSLGVRVVSFFPRLCGIYLSVRHHAWTANLSSNLFMAFPCLWVLWIKRFIWVAILVSSPLSSWTPDIFENWGSFGSTILAWLTLWKKMHSSHLIKRKRPLLCFSVLVHLV